VIVGEPIVHRQRGGYSRVVVPDDAASGTLTRGDLVLRAKDGDHDAFDVLARSVTHRLYGTALRILGDVHLAEDAVQDSLIDAWRDLRALRDPALFDAWATRILVRHCYREAKRARTARQVIVTAREETTNPTVDIDDRDRIEGAFRRLTPDHRVVIVLRHYLDWELAEIAAALGLAPGTVRSRLHYALASLRAAIEADERATPSTGGRRP
jgi:RNA polymerase sigma-70 factor, ECF subfamily